MDMSVGFLRIQGQTLLAYPPEVFELLQRERSSDRRHQNGVLEHTSEVCAHVSSKWIEVAHCVSVTPWCDHLLGRH